MLNYRISQVLCCPLSPPSIPASQHPLWLLLQLPWNIATPTPPAMLRPAAPPALLKSEDRPAAAAPRQNAFANLRGRKFCPQKSLQGPCAPHPPYFSRNPPPLRVAPSTSWPVHLFIFSLCRLFLLCLVHPSAPPTPPPQASPSLFMCATRLAHLAHPHREHHFLLRPHPLLLQRPPS